MRDIKRVLWIDDVPGNLASQLFHDNETKQMRLLEDALKEISSSHLYDYDTIVFDIDFSHGVKDVEAISAELLEKIYISPEELVSDDFIISYGGYLLYIYLLERGYPSSQVAFLTGNPTMMEYLRAFDKEYRNEMPKEVVVTKYIKAWEDAGDSEDSWYIFLDKIKNLKCPYEYISQDSIEKCSDFLEKDDEEGLRNYIYSMEIKPVSYDGMKNTGDVMIYRFHKANLETPAFFTKSSNYILGHDIQDAEQWLDTRRTNDQLTRWLILSAGYHVTTLFQNNPSAMSSQIAQVFDRANVDIGLKASFNQLYNLFYGLRDINLRGPYYQAISAMLTPFDNNPKSCGDSATASGICYDDIQRSFARLSKQSRNYCSHNYFGSEVSNETALFIILIAVTSVLNQAQRTEFDNWYDDVKALFPAGRRYVRESNVRKIDDFGYSLYRDRKINTDAFNKLHLPRAYNPNRPWKMLQVAGYNINMDLDHETNSAVREKYYIFTLASYIVKWFDGLSETDIETRFGHGIRIVFELSHEIVEDY